ncbi:Na/Pi cotransporter family protein [Neiella marina]|uniref:Na/Pi cotransporter family protein n=1 Tax=Neiella holothuriorum TaxID=2870530 RepID=A0ABS7EB93_9GAMM|nr:Na/Pi cotransporter family protein [Neiella holothuriorum]MBW8189602.1 Na/Pi cotransporter family protein [Neiella holothuriorum]
MAQPRLLSVTAANPKRVGSFIMVVMTTLLFMAIPEALAASQSPNEIDYGPMLMGLFGGLALFLFGLETMSSALKRAAGDRMRTLLAKLTTNRVMATITGTGITAIIQSSSVTTVLLVSFISAGLMSLTQAVGVIMGANIGTTVTAQIIAFKVTKTAMVMIAVGFLLQFTAKKESIRHYGDMLFGLGLIFLGMNMMGDAMAPLRSYEPFIQAMAHMDNVFIAIALSAAFTALVQSSSATTGIVIVLAGQGLIPLETGIALAMGANIGTCVTAMLAAIGKPREAVQAATVHVSFNLIGVIIWIPMLTLLSETAIAISPVHSNLDGLARQAAEIPRQIANANTLFNLLNTIVMLPFAGLFVWFARKVVPHQPLAEKKSIRTKYLSDDLLETPDLALDQAQLELGRVGRRVCNMVNMLPPLTISGISSDEQDQMRAQLKQIDDMEEDVDRLHGAILSYLGRLRLEPLSDQQSARQIQLIGITDQLESVADLVVDTMLPLTYNALNHNIVVSPKMRNALDTIQERVNQALLDCVNAVRRNDREMASRVLRAKRELNSLLEAVLEHQAERLVEQDDKRLQVFRLEMEWVDSLKRIYNLSKRIAKLHLRKRNIRES